MPTASARLLAGLAAGAGVGQSDSSRGVFKSSDSPLFAGKHSISACRSSSTSQAQQLSTAAADRAHTAGAAAGAGSLVAGSRPNTGSKWSVGAGGSSASMLQHGSGGFGVNIAGLLSKTRGPAAGAFDSIASSRITTTSSSSTGTAYATISAASGRSASVQRSSSGSSGSSRAAAGFDAARCVSSGSTQGHPSTTTTTTTSSSSGYSRLTSPLTGGSAAATAGWASNSSNGLAAGSRPRSSSVGRAARSAGSYGLSAAAWTGVGASPLTSGGAGLSTVAGRRGAASLQGGYGITSSSSSLGIGGGVAGSNQAALPGRARPVASGSGIGSSIAGRSLRTTSSGDLSAASIDPAAAEHSQQRLRSQQQQQQPLLDSRPRAPAAAARPREPSSSSSMAAYGSASTAAAASLSALPTTTSSFLAKLHQQRAATADAVSRSSGHAGGALGSSISSSSSSSVAAARRVNSASAATTTGSSSDKQQALEALKGSRLRSRAQTWGEAAVPSKAAADAAARQPSSACASAAAAHAVVRAASMPHDTTSSSRRAQEGARSSQDLERGVASLTAMLERIRSHRQQVLQGGLAAMADTQQQQQQQPQEHEKQRVIAQPRQQRQQQPQHLGQLPDPDSPVYIHGRRPATGEEAGPGERLNFPALQQQQQQQVVQQVDERLQLPAGAVSRSKSGSYLDIIRGSSGAAKHHHHHHQQLQPPLLGQQPALQQEQAKRAHAQQLLQQLLHQQQHHPHKAAQQEQQQPLYQPPQPQPQHQTQPLYQPPQQQQQQHPPAVLRQPSLLEPGSHGHGIGNDSRTTNSRSSSADTAPSIAAGSLGAGSSTSLVYRPPYAPPAPPQPAGASAGLIVNERVGGKTSSSSRGVSMHTAGMLQPATDTAAPRRRQSGGSWCSVSSDGEDATSSSGHVGSSSGDSTTTYPGTSCLRQPAAAGPLQQQQQGFVIGTQPAPEHCYDVGGQHGHTSAAAADQTAAAAVADAAARRAFLDCSSAASSPCRSEDKLVVKTAAAAAAAGHTPAATHSQHAAGSNAMTGTSSSSDVPTQQRQPSWRQTPAPDPLAAAAASASSRLSSQAAGRARVDSSSSSAAQGTALDSRRHMLVATTASVAGDATARQVVGVAAAPAGFSDSDVSEMRSSLDGSDSDSDSSICVAVHVRSSSRPISHTTSVAADAGSLTHHPLQQHVAHTSGISGGAHGAVVQQAPPGGVVLPSNSLSIGRSSSGHVSRSAMVGSPSSVPDSAAAAAARQSPIKAVACSPSRRGAVGTVVGALLPRGCCGIRNQGNTCYQNSAVQLLACVPELVGALLGPQALHLFQGAAVEASNKHWGRSIRHALLAAVAAAQDGIDWRPDALVGPALQALVCEMWGFSRQHPHQRLQDLSSYPGSPCQQQQQQLVGRVQQQQQLQRVTACMDALRSAMAESDPRWDDGDQWDCQEFCLALLQLVHNESNRVRGRPQYRELKLQGCEAQQAAEAAAYARSWEDSVVLDIFSWQLQSTMTCCTCGRASHAFDSSQELLVAIPPGSDEISVQECLARTLFSPEKMHGEEGYKCEQCKALREATKQLQLFTYPQVLLLGLKRFETRGGSKGGSKGHACDTPYTSRKVSTRVRVDAGREGVLDLSGFCNPAGLAAAAAAGRPPPRYELIAVADHSGYINGGHYTTRGRCVLDGSWVEYNDSLVMGVEAPSGSSSEAYMLLYRLIAS